MRWYPLKPITMRQTLLNFGICIIFSDVHLCLSDMKRQIIRIFVYYIQDLYIMQGFIHRSIYDASRCVPMLPECMPTPSRWITMQLRTDNSATLSRLFLTVKNNRVSLPNRPRTPMPSRCIPDAFQNESRVIPMSTDWNKSRIGIVQNQDRDGSGTVLDGIRDEWDRCLTYATYACISIVNGFMGRLTIREHKVSHGHPKMKSIAGFWFSGI